MTPSVSRSIFILGLVSMCMDISSEMIHSLLPVFLTSVLGVSLATVGVIEGIADATASITKVFSGALSDRWGKRKPLVLLGYSLAAATKPFFPLAEGAGAILFARFVDRIGKGIRGAPRDALITDIAPAGARGAAFGLRQSLDTVGGTLGPLLAMLLMFAVANDFRFVFWLAVIPALAAVALIIFGVKEPDVARAEAAPRLSIRRDLLPLFSPWRGLVRHSCCCAHMTWALRHT